jgi:type I restriction enzyme, R subunit
MELVRVDVRAEHVACHHLVFAQERRACEADEDGALEPALHLLVHVTDVRKTIIRDQLTDPRFYEQMSKLLDDLIKQSRGDAAAYEKFLKKAEALVKRLAAKQPEAGIPAVLHGKCEASVLFNNLGSIASTSFNCPTSGDEKAALALQIDVVVSERAPAGWKGDQAREAQVLNALFPILDRDRVATQALFEIIKNQPGY